MRVPMKQSIRHYPLNPKQIHILKLIYKFRFVTAPLLAEYKGLKSRKAMYTALERLLKQEYLGKRTDSNSLFQNKGGRYFLTSQARKLLRTDYGVPEKNLETLSKNKSVSEGFVDKQVDVLRLFLNLGRIYPDIFDMFTKTELAIHDYFPKPTPNLYLNRFQPTQDNKHNEYLLDLLLYDPLFLLKKRVDTYIEHYDSDEWEDEAKTKYPGILLVCPDSSIEFKIQNYVKKVLEDRGMDDEMFFYTTTLRALGGAEEQVWSNVFEPEKLISLNVR